MSVCQIDEVCNLVSVSYDPQWRPRHVHMDVGRRLGNDTLKAIKGLKQNPKADLLTTLAQNT